MSGLVFAVLLLLGLQTPGRAASTRAQPAEFEELLSRHAAEGFSGSALVATRGEILLAAGFGFADFDANRANDGDTLYEIASITKPFTATAVVKLAAQGKLLLDDSIAAHLPGVPESSRAVTLRHLLSHTSGVPRGNAAGRGEDLAKAVAEYLGAGPKRTPGTQYEYWNGGYALLAGVIERGSGVSYTQFLEREIFGPAGMTSSGFTGDADLDPERDSWGISAQGKPRRASEHPYGSYGYQYRGMGGLVTSVRDLHRFDRALAAGTILTAEHQRELFTPQRDGYALGWRIDRAPNGTARQSHGGGVRAFVSEFRRYPEADACIAVLCNRDDRNPGEIADHLEALLFGTSLVRAPRAEPLDPKRAAGCSGRFAGKSGALVIRSAPGVLWAGLEGEKLLAAVGASEKLPWKAEESRLAAQAVEIVEALGRGDAEPLRSHMAKRIPASWPDRVKESLWPEQVARHGPLRGVRAVSLRGHDGRLEVLLVLEHEARSRQALVAFSAEGLELLDWNGPAFLVEARIEIQADGSGRLLCGAESPKLVLESAAGKLAAVRLAGQRLTRE